MRSLRAFLLGAAAGAVLAYVAASTAALAATLAGAELTVGAGPVLLLAVESSSDGSESTFGSGLAVVVLACGVLNVAASWALARRVR